MRSRPNALITKRSRPHARSDKQQLTVKTTYKQRCHSPHFSPVCRNRFGFSGGKRAICEDAKAFPRSGNRSTNTCSYIRFLLAASHQGIGRSDLPYIVSVTILVCPVQLYTVQNKAMLCNLCSVKKHSVFTSLSVCLSVCLSLSLSLSVCLSVSVSVSVSLSLCLSLSLSLSLPVCQLTLSIYPYISPSL